jgi:hypothetical protein
MPNFIIQVPSMGLHYNADAGLLDYLLDTSPFHFVDGYASLPTAPGLEIEIEIVQCSVPLSAATAGATPLVQGQRRISRMVTPLAAPGRIGRLRLKPKGSSAPLKSRKGNDLQASRRGASSEGGM